MTAGSNSAQGSRSWTIAWTLAVTELISWGILYYAFTALMVPMQAEFGWSAGAITGAYSLSMLVSGLAAPLVGRWLDGHGPRGLMTAGSICGVLLVLAWSRVETLTGFYLIWVGIGLILWKRGGRKTAVPFGPFMLLGVLVAILVGQDLAQSYLDATGI